MIGHINGSYVIDVDFREGNEAPANKNLEFIKQCQLQLPLGVKFDRVRIDSAGYQAEIFNHCDKENMLFTVSGRKDKSVWEAINNLEDDDFIEFSKREKISEFLHTMNNTDNAFRMIVVKKDIILKNFILILTFYLFTTLSIKPYSLASIALMKLSLSVSASTSLISLPVCSAKRPFKESFNLCISLA